jgi:hypothetical protein
MKMTHWAVIAVMAALLIPTGVWPATRNVDITVGVPAFFPTFTYDLVAGTCTPSNGASVAHCTASGAGSLSTKGVAGGSVATNNAALTSFNLEAMCHTRPVETGYAGQGTSCGGSAAYADANINNNIVLKIPAGTFQYTNNLFGYYIRNLTISGVGSDLTTGSPTVLQNTANSGGYGAEIAFAGNWDYFGNVDLTSATIGYLINTANAGATSVTTVAAGNAANFFVGRWVLIASYDQQFNSYPPNFRYLDWARVVSFNATTGVITLDAPLNYTHLSTRPYCGINSSCGAGGLTDGTGGSIGPARIIPIDTPAKPTGAVWNVSGIHVLQNLNNPIASPASSDCFRTSGVIDETITDVHEDDGMCIESARDVTITNSRWQADESDKDVRNYTWNNVTIDQFTESHTSQMNWNVNGGTIHALHTASFGVMPLNMNMQNVSIIMDTVCGDFQPGVQYDTLLSLTQSVILNGVTFTGGNCSPNNAPINAPSRTGTSTITVDGTVVKSVTGPNGAGTRLQITKNLTVSTSPSAMAAVMFGDTKSQAGVTGSSVWKNGTLTAGCFVNSITGDATNVYIDFTGCIFATSNTVYAARLDKISVTNSVGVTTGYTWGSPNIRYPNGVSIDPGKITWTGNSGT